MGGATNNNESKEMDAFDCYPALMEDSSSQHSIENDMMQSTPSSNRKRSRHSSTTIPDDIESKRKNQAFQEWIETNFGMLPLGEETKVKVNSDGDDFPCFRLSSKGRNSVLCFVRHAKIHKSLLGWIESCSVAVYDQSDELVTPTTFGDDSRVALKVFDLKTIFSTETKENAMKELMIHARLSSKHSESVSPMLECFRTEDKVIAVFPMYSRGDLFEFLTSFDVSNHKMTEAEVRPIMIGALNAIAGCHRQGICHRDVSLENFCIDNENLRPVLIDFGVATEMDVDTGLVPHTGPLGKAKYMAPELYDTFIQRPVYDGRKCDVFSLGVMMLILMLQMEPWDSTSMSDIRFTRMVLNGELELVLRAWGYHVSSSFMQLLTFMLNPNPDLRPTVEEALKHEWFNH